MSKGLQLLLLHLHWFSFLQAVPNMAYIRNISNSEDPLSILRSIYSNSSFDDPGNATGLYYIYPWNESFYWRFPSDNSSCKEGLQHFMFENSGIGRAIDAKMGLMETWHHAMFSSIWNRVKRSKRRTMDPELASLFIIPYDITVDTSYKPNCKHINPEFKFPQTQTLKKVQLLLKESKYFHRYNGTDHLVLNSFRSFGKSKKKQNFLLDICKKCLKTCFFRFRTHSDRFVPVPYASSFHYHDQIQKLPWVYPKKTILVTYVGGWKTDVSDSAKLRYVLVESCQKSNKCVLKRIMHIDNALSKYTYHEYRHSTFCLQPPGDDPSRKGVIDSILSGCIPVTFHPDTLLTALPLHLSESEARKILIYIPDHVVRNSSFSIIHFLENIPKEVVAFKQDEIAAIAYRLQYSMPPIHYLKDRVDQTVWDPPFPDAVDVLLDGMIALANANRELKGSLFADPYNITDNSAIIKKYNAIVY